MTVTQSPGSPATQTTTWFETNDGHVSEKEFGATTSEDPPEEVRAWDDYSDIGSDFDPDTVPETFHDAWFMYYSDPAKNRLYREAPTTLADEDLSRIEDAIFHMRYRQDERWC